MTPAAADFIQEREALRATLTQLGPAAPTACGDWTTADIAVHIVTGELAGALPNAPFRFLVGRGVRIDWMAPLNRQALERSRRRHGFDWALARLARRPPLLHCSRPIAPVSLLEVWAHHEDVLAANEVGICTSGVDVAPVVRVLARYQRRFLSDYATRVSSPTGVWYAPAGEARVEVRGALADVARWLSGRAGLDGLEVAGQLDAVEALSAALPRI